MKKTLALSMLVATILGGMLITQPVEAHGWHHTWRRYHCGNACNNAAYGAGYSNRGSYPAYPYQSNYSAYPVSSNYPTYPAYTGYRNVPVLTRLRTGWYH